MQHFSLVVYTEPLDALASLDAPRRSGRHQTLTFDGFRIGAAMTVSESGVCDAVRLYGTAEHKIVAAYDQIVLDEKGIAACEFSDVGAESADTFETLGDAERWLIDEMGAPVRFVTSVIRGAEWVLKNETSED